MMRAGNLVMTESVSGSELELEDLTASYREDFHVDPRPALDVVPLGFVGPIGVIPQPLVVADRLRVVVRGAVNHPHVVGQVLAEQLPASALGYGARGGESQGGGYDGAQEGESDDKARHDSFARVRVLHLQVAARCSGN